MIQVLPDIVINQIAAGEVVDRPSSVVRELVDNAVDASAHSILVELEQGGHQRIRVQDDGVGMSGDDLKLAFTRHATSKLSSLHDLQTLSTLGFRGEALPSIASIARVVVKSKNEAAQGGGHELTIEGGEMLSSRPCAAPRGTDIEVTRLFYNTPARRKFLKQPRTEFQKIRSWLVASAFGNPSVRYRLVHDGKEALLLAPRESLERRARDVIDGTAVEVVGSYEGITVRGLVAHPSLAQSEAGALALLVNGRLISDKMILRAVKEGFDSTLKDREVPRGVIALTMNPADVDVNVHPQKSEVRFTRSSDVFVAVREAVRRSVRAFSTPVFSSSPAVHSYTASPLAHTFATDRAPATFVAERPDSSPLSESWSTSTSLQGEIVPAPTAARFCYSDIAMVGQALGLYIIGELRGELIVLDMHAAHERISFNRIRAGLSRGSLPSQSLAIPLTISLTPEGASRCEALAPLLAKIGISVEPFGDDSIIVRESPTMFRVEQLTALLRDVASLDHDSTEALVKGAVQEHLDHLAARLACHASVRSGDLLSREEMRALLRDLDEAELSSACPHGRPVIVSFTRDQIDRWFGRDR